VRRGRNGKKFLKFILNSEKPWLDDDLFLFPMNFNEFVKSRIFIEFVIPAKAGIQLFQDVLNPGEPRT
jgi:hypothetical protein